MKIVAMKREKGFTLIEVIVVLILLGIMGAVLATAVVTAVNGFMFTKDSALKSQKAQLALGRIERELLDMTGITAVSRTSITYTTSYGTFLLTKTGSTITLAQTAPTAIAAQPLIDDVSTSAYTDTTDTDAFLICTKSNGDLWVNADYTAATPDISILYAVKVKLKLNGYAGVQTLNFETTVNPRNKTLPNAPILY
jgi:prepilin-type N-terminal cleavage/methylation domain-containing protein